jgi:mRNA interferase MazF
MKPKIERGDIWWINLDPTRGAEIRKQRPCAVVSADAINRWRATPVVVPLSASPQDAPPVVVSVPSAGTDSVAVVDQIRAVDRTRFVSKQGKLSDADMSVLEKALKRVLELP